MASTNDLKNGMVLDLDGQLWQVLWFQHHKPGKGNTVVRSKLKHVLSGKVVDRTFNSDTKVDTATVDRREMQYLYLDGEDYVFMDPEYNSYELRAEDLESVLPFIEEGMTDVCEAVFFEGKVISVDLPTTIVRQVVYTETAARGDTSGKVMKPAKLRNGTEVKVADFVNIDDWIEIDTRDGSYKVRTQAPQA